MSKPISLFKESTESILNCLDFSILVIDQHRNIQFANQTMVQELRRDLSDIIGKTCHEICHNLSHPCRPSEANCPVNMLKNLEEPLGIVHNHITASDENDIVYVSAVGVSIKKKPYYLCLSMRINGHGDTVSAQKTRQTAIRTILDALGEVD